MHCDSTLSMVVERKNWARTTRATHCGKNVNAARAKSLKEFSPQRKMRAQRKAKDEAAAPKR